VEAYRGPRVFTQTHATTCEALSRHLRDVPLAQTEAPTAYALAVAFGILLFTSESLIPSVNGC
jgi:hypothetical protein